MDGELDRASPWRMIRRTPMNQPKNPPYDGSGEPLLEGEILAEIDDFTDETIVDQIPELVGAPSVKKIATPPTPVAQPPRPSKKPSIYGAVRVSVRRGLGGTWEVRPLGERESPPAGDEEALLVPLRPGTKFA